MEQARPAHPGEFGEVMRFIDAVFRPGQAGRRIMQGQYPHLFVDQRRFLRRYHIVRDDKRIVGHVGIHPVQLRFEDVRVRAGGIGQVGVDPAYRRQGVMSGLLEHAVDWMRRDGCAVSILGGDRQRYGWFGWENAGTRNLFGVGHRYAGAPTPAERRLPIRRLRVTPAVARRMLAADEMRPYGAARAPAEIRPLFERRGRELWGCQVQGRFAYVLLGGAGRRERPYERIDETGGDPELVQSMIRVLMARYGCDRLTAIAGPNPDDVACYVPLSGGWSRQTDGMVKIVDLQLLLAGLEPLLKRRARAAACRGAFHFAMQTSHQEGTLRLGRGRTHHVRLPDGDMVRLFFGLLPLAECGLRASLPRELAGLLPIPLFVPPVNHV